MQASAQAFRRVAIVNRGEPAMRLINAVREWNAQGLAPLRTIAIYTAVDRTAMFVREADEAVLIGPDDPDVHRPVALPRLRRAASGASPSPAPTPCGRAGASCRRRPSSPGCARDMDIVFVGPSAEVMERLGDKIASKLLAEEVGVPMAAWSDGPVADIDAAREHAERIGYPLMVKATAGGGGRGIRKVERPRTSAEAFERRLLGGRRRPPATPRCSWSARSAGGRHVEVQVVADATATSGRSACATARVQRRNQKVLEESASTALDAEQERAPAQLGRRAREGRGLRQRGHRRVPLRAARAAAVVPRGQHPAAGGAPGHRGTTGVDIVKLQLHVAAGGKLAEIAPQTPPARGHAIEARLTAEDPEQGFAPAPGHIEHLNLPAGPGVRVDTGVAAGDTIPPQFDSMIAKIIAWGRDRDEARARLSRALRADRRGDRRRHHEQGVPARPARPARGRPNGEFDTTWLDTMMADGYAPPRRTDVALLAAADRGAGRARGRASASASSPPPSAAVPRSGTRRGTRSTCGWAASPTGCGSPSPAAARYHVELDGKAVDVEAERTGRFERKLAVGDTTFAVLSAPQGSGLPRRGRRHRAPHLRRRGGHGARARRPRWSCSIPVVGRATR